MYAPVRDIIMVCVCVDGDSLPNSSGDVPSGSGFWRWCCSHFIKASCSRRVSFIGDDVSKRCFSVVVNDFFLFRRLKRIRHLAYIFWNSGVFSCGGFKVIPQAVCFQVCE